MSDKELLPEGFNELGLEDLAELKSALRDQALGLRDKDAPTADDVALVGQIKTALATVEAAIAEKTNKAEIEAALSDIEEVFETEDAELDTDDVDTDDTAETTEEFEADAEDDPEVDTDADVDAELELDTDQEDSIQEDAEDSEEFEADAEVDADDDVVADTEVAELDTESDDAELEEAQPEAEMSEDVEAEDVATDDDAQEFNEDIEDAEVSEVAEEAEANADALEVTEDTEVVTDAEEQDQVEASLDTDLDDLEGDSEAPDAELDVEDADDSDDDAEVEVELSEISETQEEDAKVAELNNVTDEESNEMSEKTEGALDSAEFFVPSESAAPRSSVIATAGATTKNVGDAYNDMGELALEVGASWKRLGGERGWTNVAQGANEQFNIASFVSNDEEVPTVSTMNEERNFQVFDQAIDTFRGNLDTDNALVASGGICAPFQQDYSFFRLALPQNPVEAALPVVNASRGGIRYMAPVDFTGARSSIAVVTEAEDAAGYAEDGGPTANKPCPVVACPPVQECVVDAVPYCVKWGNFNYYTFPELIENYMRDLMVNFAKVKETHYLDKIKAASTAVTASDSPYGATRSITDELRRAAVNYRKRHNMNTGATLQVMLPDWSGDLIKQDMINDHALGLNNVVVSDALVAQIFSDMGLAVSFYYDTATGDGQDFAGAQGAGALNAWPATVISFMFAPGTFVRLSGGSLDFGLVRDSSLIRTNDLIVAAEEFTGLCQIGYESLMITHEAVASGAAVNAATAANAVNTA